MNLAVPSASAVLKGKQPQRLRKTNSLPQPPPNVRETRSAWLRRRSPSLQVESDASVSQTRSLSPWEEIVASTSRKRSLSPQEGPSGSRKQPRLSNNKTRNDKRAARSGGVEKSSDGSEQMTRVHVLNVSRFSRRTWSMLQRCIT